MLIKKIEPQYYENTNIKFHEKDLYDLDKLSFDDSHKE